MSIDDYKNAGYPMSVHVSQAAIDRAEADVLKAYIYPLDATADVSQPGAARAATMELANLLVMQRSINATRAGAKEKTTAQSYTPSRWDLLSQCSASCVLKMQAYSDAVHAERWQRVVTDICGILFNTNYLCL